MPVRLQSDADLNRMEQGLPQQTDAVDVNQDGVTSTVYRGLSSCLGKMLVVADYMGEKVASCLGITDSRYQYYVDEAEREEEGNAAAATMSKTVQNASALSQLP